MDSPGYTPSLGFWVTTTFVIIGSVFIVFLAGARPSLEQIFGTYFAFALELAFVSGICVGLLQSSLMPHLSSPAKAHWFGITFAGTTVGWFIVFAIAIMFGKLFPNLPIFSDQIVTAIFKGLLIGGSMGAIIGLVTGIVQARFQHLSARQWVVSNVVSWSIGIGIPVAVFFAFLSQASLFF